MLWITRIIDFFSTSHQRKLLLVVAGVVTLVMGAFGIYLVYNQGQIAATELEGRATRTATLLAQTTALSLWNLDSASIDAQINAVMADKEVQTVTVYETGKSQPFLTKSRETPAVNPITQKAPIILLRGTESTLLGSLEIVYSQERLQHNLYQIQVLLVVIIIALILILVISIYFLEARLVTGPLHEITTLTSRVSAGDYSGRAKLTSRDEIGVLAAAFNSMTDQLQQTLEELEQRVQDRTLELEQKSLQLEYRAVQLQAITDVSKAVAAINDFDELLPAIVRSVGERFGLYHVGIYLLNETKDWIILSAASGESSESLVEKKFKLRVDATSMCGYAASRGQPKVALDVKQDSSYLAVSDLPETRSEAALPLLAGTQTIGVLDLQSANPNSFTGQDINFLMTLANQVALFIQNARSFGETRQALQESEKIYRQFVEQGWKSISGDLSSLGYKYAADQITPFKAGDLTPEEKAGSASNKSNRPDSNLMTVPIQLRGQTIGNMSIRSTDPKQVWDADELVLIQAAADRAALALENARLLKDSQRRAAKERVIGEISSKISETADIDGILQTAVQELYHAVPGCDVSIHMAVETDDNLPEIE
jgi:GAF domain-containing protein/HAMP domain-containing protein